MMKHMRAKVATAIALAFASVAVVALPAYASTNVAIDDLESPFGYGKLHTTLEWYDLHGFDFSSGYLQDLAADGHGPYLHVWAEYLPSSQSYWSDTRITTCDIHNTSGYNTTKGVTLCDWSPTNTIIGSINVWVCNGGDSTGANTVEGGCYGRRYYNPYWFNTGSESLGTTYSPYGGGQSFPA